MIDRLPAFSAPPGSPTLSASKESASTSGPAFLPWALSAGPASPSSGTAPEPAAPAPGTIAVEAGAAVPMIPLASGPALPSAFRGDAAWLAPAVPSESAVSAAMPAIPAPQLAGSVPPSSTRTSGEVPCGAHVAGMNVPNESSPTTALHALSPPDVPVLPAEPGGRASVAAMWWHAELHFTETGRGQDIVIVPLRLRAVGTLAQLPVPATGFVPPSFIDAVMVVSDDARVAARASVPEIARLADGVAAGEGTAAIEAQAPAPLVPRQDEREPSDGIAASHAGTLTDAANWLARWVGWIQRTGRPPSLWLRDYRLDPDDARRMADALHRAATADGIVLERIVVNGRELWRDAQARPFHEPRE